MKNILYAILTLTLAYGQASGQNVVAINAGTTASGDTGSFTVTMKNTLPINGLNFIVQYDPAVISPFQITSAGNASLLGGPGASFFGGNRIGFLLFDSTGAFMGPDSGEIFEIRYTVADSVYDSAVTRITFQEASAADSALDLVLFDYIGGEITVTPATGVDGPAPGLPAAYRLFQNYPNPFNPSTIIRYELPRQSRVTITVYNLLGQKVSTLVNDVMTPGTHTIAWDAARMPAGVYFCRLAAGGYSGATKLILLK